MILKLFQKSIKLQKNVKKDQITKKISLQKNSKRIKLQISGKKYHFTKKNQKGSN